MTDDWLRDALDDAVSDVEPNDALDSIRSRTKVTPMSSKRPWMYGAGGALLATAATITAFALFNNGGTPQSADPGPASTSSQSPDQTPTDASPGPSVVVPAYYLGEVTYHAGEGGEMQTAFRLYREFGNADGTSIETAAAGALERMFGSPNDPDYASPWNDGIDVLSVTHDGGVISVDLTGPVQQANVGAESAELAVQQLVYTVQGALSVMQEMNATDPVQILIDGEPAGDLWGHVDASRPIARADATGTQAPIWISEPADGTVQGNPVVVSGIAQVFEATVSWRLLKDGAEVDSGFTNASEGAPAFGSYTFDFVGLVPGEYVVEVFESSALDGSDTFKDTKTFTVE
ncbi:MAG TPA: Gmad2 immunoglobulin-like domain-containing protein [Nocardioidaceae bacterium]|nr:Gmad2 immunoglobulin-like domain-containing protein [Nocardioidaceae bacterium]